MPLCISSGSSPIQARTVSYLARAGVADPRGFDQLGGLGVGARGDRMGDGLAGHLVIAMPGVRPAVQGRGRARLPPLELDPQQLGEQRVEAVPPALVIQGDKEEVAGRQRGEHRSGVLLLQYRIAQRAGQPSEDRGAQHQRLHRRIMRLEHLRLQEVDHVAARGAQLVHQAVAVGGPPQRERRQGKARPASPPSARGDHPPPRA